MAIRADITIDWGASPREIIVDAPSTSLSIQDLIDTCRSKEAENANIDENWLVNASGLEELEIGNVGLTVQLQNAIVCFEGRSGPTWADCRISGGNLTAVDAVGSSIYPVGGKPYVNVSFAQDTTASLVETGVSGVTAQDLVDFRDQVFQMVMENGETFLEQQRLIRAFAAGAITADPETGDYIIKSADGLIDRITGTGSTSGRTTTVDPS